MIEVSNLVKRYGNHLAVNNLSFTVDRRQILGFLGPNGAGKSTTMNIITGYLSATEGTVKINGYDIYEQPEKAKKEIGYLPETPPLYIDMTPYEYLKFVAELKGVEKSKQQNMIKDIMKTVKIEDVSERLIKNLSKGYKQRVGLAQALVGYPEVLILDEPTVGLDPKQIIEIRDFIKKLSNKHTIILSSHILSEISAICDRVMIINKGELVASDTPENLSRLLSGSGSLIIRAKGNKKTVDEILSRVGQLKEVVYKNSNEPGTTDAIVFSNDEADIREGIFRAFSQANQPILMMKANELTLEEIFLQVTDGKKSLVPGENTLEIVSKEQNETAIKEEAHIKEEQEKSNKAGNNQVEANEENNNSEGGEAKDDSNI